MSEELSKRWRDSWLRGKTKFHTQDTIHDLGDAMATRLDILEAENAELKRRLAGVLQCRQTHDDAYSVLAIANSEYAELATLVGVKHD